MPKTVEAILKATKDKVVITQEKFDHFPEMYELPTPVGQDPKPDLASGVSKTAGAEKSK